MESPQKVHSKPWFVNPRKSTSRSLSAKVSIVFTCFFLGIFFLIRRLKQHEVKLPVRESPWRVRFQFMCRASVMSKSVKAGPVQGQETCREAFQFCQTLQQILDVLKPSQKQKQELETSCDKDWQGLTGWLSHDGEHPNFGLHLALSSEEIRRALVTGEQPTPGTSWVRGNEFLTLRNCQKSPNCSLHIWWYLMIVDDSWWYLMIVDDIWWYLMIVDDIWW